MTTKPSYKPWHEVVQLRDDLKTGELSLAVFAADLYDVIMQKGPAASVRTSRRILRSHLSHLQSAGTSQRRGLAFGRQKRQSVPKALGQLRRWQNPYAHHT